MFGLTRWSPFEDVLNFQREVDRLFNQFWSDLPARTDRAGSSFQVYANDDEWKVEIPLPGIDPRNVSLDAAGHTVTIRADQPASNDAAAVQYEQSFAVPQFLDVEKITASYRHGMLQLTFPLTESVKPRRIDIEGVTDQKQIASAA